jgi:putative ABC transport system permease protein
MLSQWFPDEFTLGIAQAAVAAAFLLLFSFFLLRIKINLFKEILIAMLRSLVQIVAVGSVLILVLNGPIVLGGLVLLGMMASAAITAARRVKNIPGAQRAVFFSIVLGSGSIVALMTFVGVIEWKLESIIPVGSMMINGGMIACALGLERFRAEVQAHTDQIETRLALGAQPKIATDEYVRAAFQASMIPRIDSMRSLGIVWIPGLMAGMILAGSSPLYAGIYQFVVIAMLLVSSGVSALISVVLVQKRIFSKADQLLLKSTDDVIVRSR